MAWLAIVLIVFVILLTRSLVLNALRLKRDVDKRFDDLRDRLERQANSTVEPLLKPNASDRSESDLSR
jgi:hypothetical protein